MRDTIVHDHEVSFDSQPDINDVMEDTECQLLVQNANGDDCSHSDIQDVQEKSMFSVNSLELTIADTMHCENMREIRLGCRSIAVLVESSKEFGIL